ncbi:glycoside hydrolase 100 family protein [Paraflavisolibacter sp. H34]|uniref:glycoside hydrolase 100 family protein n=1 Tax=Huijunlia imazamoxiresistens TaxID=3127457 RepID=UPI00301AA17B
MNYDIHSGLGAKALSVLRAASAGRGIRATTEQTENYNNVWARDSAVAGLALLAAGQQELYPALKESLVLLQQAADGSGQIPSNITVAEDGRITRVSFGGPAGRTDASFWWLIAALLYLHRQEDGALKNVVFRQCTAIFQLANHWEFNHNGLMYVPMSSNWADEYVTHGYVLYDQLLRYWALGLAGSFFQQESWQEKALSVKVAIKQHYLLEAELDNSLYTAAQRAALRSFDLSQNFIASFSPGDRVEKYDAWSIALLLLLDIPSEASTARLVAALVQGFRSAGGRGVPAFWPVVDEGDALYERLQQNHHYRFKNRPGHFHNGGLWPVVNGFLVAGLQQAGRRQEAEALMTALHNLLAAAHAQHPFAEYFDLQTASPGGVGNLCFSAAGYLLGAQALAAPAGLQHALGLPTAGEARFLHQVRAVAAAIVEQLPLNGQGCLAVSIAGESGCGKTTLGTTLHELLLEKGHKVLLLHQDEYFRLPPRQNHEARLQDFDHIGPSEVRLDLLDEHIRLVKEGAVQKLISPVMNWATDTEESRELEAGDVGVILVDGTYTSLLKAVDYRVFLSATYKETRQNRIRRNRETVTAFIEQVLEKESRLIQPGALQADVVVDAGWEPRFCR